VTLGGAIASDIHGKNHHRDGGLARYVTALRLCTPALGCIEVTPASDEQLFYATLGGMGLTGVVTEATLAVEELGAPWLAQDTDRSDGFEHTLELMRGPESHRFSVAWLDLLASGAKLGRAVLLRADRLGGEEARGVMGEHRRSSRERFPADLLRRSRLQVPRGFPGAPLRESVVRAFNALHWRRAPRSERARPVALTPYFFPLDWVGEWHRLYGAGGLMQYQFVLPDGQEDALVRCLELIRARRLPIYLAVFKRFGEEFGGPLSFPLAGWTLAMDLPAAAAGARAALDELDELVAGCGGRVYLTKDARLRASVLAAMYPRLGEFLAQRERVDPEGILRSDLAQRVGLAGAAR
jgi:decaprenylphospho-beta-D-ribofuranose 2-oxidase